MKPTLHKAYLLYIEHPVSVPLKIGHDGGSYKELIGVFRSVNELDEFTQIAFDYPYSKALMHLGFPDGKLFTQQYCVEPIPMYCNMDSLKYHANKLKERIEPNQVQHRQN